MTMQTSFPAWIKLAHNGEDVGFLVILKWGGITVYLVVVVDIFQAVEMSQ
jgi:hypothetical protein